MRCPPPPAVNRSTVSVSPSLPASAAISCRLQTRSHLVSFKLFFSPTDGVSVTSPEMTSDLSPLIFVLFFLLHSLLAASLPARSVVPLQPE